MGFIQATGGNGATQEDHWQRDRKRLHVCLCVQIYLFLWGSETILWGHRKWSSIFERLTNWCFTSNVIMATGFFGGYIKWVIKKSALDKEKEKYSALWIYFKHKFLEMHSLDSCLFYMVCEKLKWCNRYHTKKNSVLILVIMFKMSNYAGVLHDTLQLYCTANVFL